MINLIEEGFEFLPQFKKRNGLLPVAVQETSTGQIVMIASVNKDALEMTIRTKKATFWSTSKNKLWTKGETSGNSLFIDEILIDCDQDALVFKVTLEKGGVCHTFNQFGQNRKACFYRSVNIYTQTLEFIEK